MKNRLQKEFDSFALACFGDISSQQYTDLRRTFFGGAAAIYGLVMNGISDGPETTPADLQMMADLQTEMREFNEAVKAGTK